MEGAWDTFKKRIGSWFHFSFLGFGHSEAIGRLTPAGRRLLPGDTKYEAQWWKRKVTRDGGFSGQEYDAELALGAATEYAKRVSIGNLSILRNFLEASIRKSERPGMYLEIFPMMLVARGRDFLMQRLKRLFQITSTHSWQISNSHLDMVVKTMLGITRKRELLIPEWAE